MIFFQELILKEADRDDVAFCSEPKALPRERIKAILAGSLGELVNVRILLLLSSELQPNQNRGEMPVPDLSGPSLSSLQPSQKGV